MKTEKIDSIVKRVLNKIEIPDEKNRNIDITVLWPRIIDEKMRGKSYVLYEKEKKLYIKVENSCFLSLCRMNKKKIIEKLKEFGFNYIDIKFLI
ncbi:MAG TPA: DciA family protein [bacterium]|nr:DciA family protein [bacterium]HOM26067.1 DciA family protein [bacterium]